ncbi:vancomycin high temperature exclusion protein [uncultured Clostridium sp.]|nr:vancomycin high temperature exclusion protein [uncultured Clostridium sp.]
MALFKRRGIIRRLLSWILILVLILGGINLYVIFKVKGRIVPLEQAAGIKADCVLVLGAGVRGDGAPTPMLKDRLTQGIALYQVGASDRLLMSGDHGTPEYDEVNAMKQFAVDSGVPSEKVFMDHAGFSTYESVYRAQAVFQAKKVIIVSQGYHLYRALYVADALGLEAYGVTADLQPYQGQWARQGREALARVKDFFFGLFKPAPTYLGEAIPVSGNGDDTAG